MNTEKILPSLFILVLLVSSCQEQKKDKITQQSQSGLKIKLKMEDVPSDSLAFINQSIISESGTQSGFASTAAKGNLWLAFKSTFNACFQDETFRKNIIYLGPSNSRYIGAIVSRDHQSTWQDLWKILNYDSNKMSKIILKGRSGVGNCNNNDLLNKYFDIMLSEGISKSVNGYLKLALEDRKNITMVTGAWRVDELLLGDFNTYLDTTKNAALKKYATYLLKKDKYIITKVLVIDNFEANVETNRSINAGLQAQLNSGVIANLKTDSSDSSNIEIGLKFKRSRDGKINVKVVGSCYAMGMVQKVKNVKE